MFCGKCGKQIPDGYEFCMHCGEKIIPDLQANENVSIPKTKISKKMIFVPIAILLFVVTGLFMGSKFLFKDSGYFRNTTWGMSIEQVKKTEKETPFSEEKDKLLYMVDDNKGLDGISTFVSYSFTEDGKLTNGTIMIVDTEMDTNKVRNDLVKLYEDLYGKEHETTGYSYTWTASKSVIEISVVTDGFIGIDFKEIEK